MSSVHGLQVSYAITASARHAAGEGPPGKASPRKRPRTDNGGAESNEMATHASALFVEKGSPIALAKAIKNKVDVIDIIIIRITTTMIIITTIMMITILTIIQGCTIRNTRYVILNT